MATKNNPGAFDCYAKADPDEPMFILLGRDKHAPTLVWLWAAMREIHGEDPVVVAEARSCAVAMIDYADQCGRKSVGLGEAVMAGVLELMSAVNAAIKAQPESARNAASDLEVVRRFLAQTNVDGKAD